MAHMYNKVNVVPQEDAVSQIPDGTFWRSSLWVFICILDHPYFMRKCLLLKLSFQILCKFFINLTLRLSANVTRLNVATTNINSLATTLQRKLPDDLGVKEILLLRVTSNSNRATGLSSVRFTTSFH